MRSKKGTRRAQKSSPMILKVTLCYSWCATFENKEQHTSPLRILHTSTRFLFFFCLDFRQRFSSLEWNTVQKRSMDLPSFPLVGYTEGNVSLSSLNCHDNEALCWFVVSQTIWFWSPLQSVLLTQLRNSAEVSLEDHFLLCIWCKGSVFG